MNRELTLRGLVLAAIIALGAILAPNALRAQTGLTCLCDSINVINNSNCSAEVCVLPAATSSCHTIAPGTSGKVRCVNGGGIAIRDCSGNLHRLSVGCIHLAIAPGCCVRVCLVQAATGCYTLTIGPPEIICDCI
ncbi:MAG TPA: hypothetical protein VHI13_21400 [Candidatus Kapabacteria bacterium]|nr:hypothetical protein [Candidatus Kapabacteria bacterium]